MRRLSFSLLSARLLPGAGAALLLVGFSACAGHTTAQSSSLAGLAPDGLTFEATD